MESVKKAVALCTSRVYDPMVHGYIEKLNRYLSRADIALLVFTINSDLYWKDDRISAETAVFDLIPYDYVDAVVIMDEKIKSHTITDRIRKSAEEHETPAVVIDGHVEGLYHVNFDYAAGFEKVVRHVMEAGDIKKPHIMAGIPGNPFSEERIEAFKKVIGEYGISFDESMLSYGQFWATPAREETEKIIASGNIPDAIICANDIMAINVCDVLYEHGYSVPGDLLVSGFDGYDEVFITTPRITTVSCTTPDLADATGELLIRILEGKESAKVCDVSVVPVLITNESTGSKPRSGYDHFMLSRFNNMFYRHHDETRIMYEVATGMQMSSDENELISHLTRLLVNDQSMMTDTCFVLNRHIFNVDDYYFDDEGAYFKLKDCNIVYDADVSAKLVEKKVKKTLLTPEDKDFLRRINSGYPLIFNSLDYMNYPMGYICYNYPDYDITKYSRSANVTNTISMGIGGYVNMQYQQSLSAKMHEMYRKDALTGLYNRLGFNDIYDRLKNDGSLAGKPVSVIMSDLDGLKYINDNFGHAEGDNAIFMVAQALMQACPENAICVRFGGDEVFSVIIGDCDSARIVDRIEESLSGYNRISDKGYLVDASCGVYNGIFDEEFDIKNALHVADQNMYRIKGHKKR